MTAEQYGTHTFGDAEPQAEPDHIVKAREYRKRKTEIDAELATAMRGLQARQQRERDALTAEFDTKFKQLQTEAGWR
jgi:hypothetical protein